MSNNASLQLDLFCHENPIPNRCEKLDSIPSNHDVKNWGTFKDSLRAPVHRWFAYPAGFSFQAVQHSFERFGVKQGMTAYDPFMGSGTTNIVAKSLGVHSVGVEAHPFVIQITKAKMCWNLDDTSIEKFLNDLSHQFDDLYTKKSTAIQLEEQFPELILKCYTKITLLKLLTIRDYFNEYDLGVDEKNFLFASISALLRNVSSAATGWPYIAPKKAKTTSESKDPLAEFLKLSRMMLKDLAEIKSSSVIGYEKSKHTLLLGSSVDVSEWVPNSTIDHIFTSPPYLNNFDYSDRTRLELYFWGHAANWADITNNIRSKLMVSATTQIVRSDPKYTFCEDFKNACPESFGFLNKAVADLGELRKRKGGKKSYDLMVIGYFNDIYRIIRECFRVLKPKTKALFVLGDSAPYGVHIPTDLLIGEIGCCIGFDNFTIEILRKRGDKWKSNPQRHDVALQESIVILEKK